MPSDGGKVSGSRDGGQIVKEMFEAREKKQLSQKEQLAQLQKQSQAQQNLQRGQAPKKGEDVREAQAERAKRAGDQQVRQRSDTRTKEEKAMDSFLQRSSVSQQQREAGKTLTQQTKANPQSAQSWNVANSHQAPPQVRKAILAQQQLKQEAQQNARHLPLASQPLHPQGAATLRGTLAPMVKTGTPLERLIQYARAQHRGGETGARPFLRQGLVSQNLFRQIQKMVAEQQKQAGQTLPTQKPVVTVHLRGNLIFVRDGDKVRAFRLCSDGTLKEVPTEDSSEAPLSKEALSQLKKVLAKHGFQFGEERLSEEGGDIDAAKLEQILREKILEGEEGKAELDFETRFAILLYEVLEESKQLGKKLGAGEDPQFLTKKDWAAFFANLLKLGNQEKTAKKTLDEILSLIFRGMFQKKGAGNFLVGDLKFLQSGKNREEKFTQIQVTSEKLLQLLAQLKPGQKISPELLAEFFGEELAFLKMAHKSEKSYIMAEGAEKNVVFNPKSLTDPYSQARLEFALATSRRENSRQRQARGEEGAGQYPQGGGHPSGVFANTYELMGLRQRFQGRPRLYTVIAYAAIAGSIGLAVAYFLLKAF